jgi:hypothetical protein
LNFFSFSRLLFKRDLNGAKKFPRGCGVTTPIRPIFFQLSGEKRVPKKRPKYKRHGFLFNFLFLVLQFVCCFTSFLFYSPVFI